MKRRECIAVLGGTAILAPRASLAQTPARIYRLALVSPGGPLPESSPYARILLGALAQLGYMPGQNLVFQGPRTAAAQPVSHLPELMDELKAGKVDAIVVFGYPTAIAA